MGLIGLAAQTGASRKEAMRGQWELRQVLYPNEGLKSD